MFLITSIFFVLVLILWSLAVTLGPINRETNNNLPYPTPEEFQASEVVDDSPNELLVLAHISDLHVGNSTYVTENTSILYDFLKRTVQPDHILNTGDLTLSKSSRCVLPTAFL